MQRVELNRVRRLFAGIFSPTASGDDYERRGGQYGCALLILIGLWPGNQRGTGTDLVGVDYDLEALGPKAK